MSSELFRLAAEITRPLGHQERQAEGAAITARSKAREIIDGNPRATLTELVALGYLEGRIDVCRELRPTLHDNSFTCQRCGRKVRAASTAPADMAVNYVCFDCSSCDEPGAA